MSHTRLDFLVPGVSKCGTTTLCAMLSEHPRVYIPDIKETWHFIKDDWRERQSEFDQHFAPAQPDQLLGEGSVSYSGYEHEDAVIPRLLSHNPDLKFIFILRNPKARIESSYREMHHSGVLFGVNAPYELWACLEKFPQMVADSMYFDRVHKYMEAFGRDAVMVILLEELKSKPAETLLACFQHIGLHDSEFTPSTKTLNAGAHKRYDSKLLRIIRTNPYLGMKLAKLDPTAQAKWLEPLGLRPKFRRPIEWDSKSEKVLAEEIMPNAKRLLADIGKPIEIWD